MASPAWAALPGPAADAALCRLATADAEAQTGVPDQLLTAISRVETGQYDPDARRMAAWPWSLNVEGASHFYASKAQALTALAAFQGAGARSIDVGCMQINLLQHPDAFASPDQALDPAANARYAAQFLMHLFQQTRSWPHAAAAYHSQTPSLGQDYQVQVLRLWADGDGPAVVTPSKGKAVRVAGLAEPPQAPGGAIMPASGGAFSGSPFAASAMQPAVQHYGPAVSRLPPGSNRGLSAYRGMPITMQTHPLYASRF